jgi:hypothetical protein
MTVNITSCVFQCAQMKKCFHKLPWDFEMVEETLSDDEDGTSFVLNDNTKAE